MMMGNKSAWFGVVILASLTGAQAQIIDQGGLVAPGAEVVRLGEGYSFTEGPIADKKGNVFFTDQPNNQILKWVARTGEIETFTKQAGRGNGMFFDKKGNLIVCADENNQLWSMDKKGRPTVLVKEREGKLLNGPNDVWVHPGGDIYFTDPLYKRNYWTRNPESQQDGEHVYLFRKKTGQLEVLNTGVIKPNGIIGSPDGKRLYVADIGDRKIYVYDIAQDGYLLNRKIAAPMGADGITLDANENLYLAGDGVTVFNRNGEKIAHIPVRKGWTANVTFGGKDRKLLFMTAGDAVFGLRMNVKGAY